MVLTDYCIIVGVLAGMIVVGGIFVRKIQNSKDMFTAGGQSPWWVSGLSGFMTMFSAGTFVVWGGIAYQYGFVAISINMCYGIAAFIVGKTIAAHWQRMGLTTVAEYIGLRFGKATVQGFTWIKGFLAVFGMGSTIYAFSRIFCALVPLGNKNVFADPATGHLSIPLTSVILGAVVIAYTMSGGLWAVLMTGVLQFIILTSTVFIVVPLALHRVGGFSAFISKTPEGFFNPVAAEYTWAFILGWIMIHYFMIGGEWYFAQRFICVPSEKDAKRSAYLFGLMYLISPFLWMLPPMVYRTINPNAHHEEAYILMCQNVLPAGLLGLVIAAMFSATASTVSSVLNVFAGVYTHDIYRLVKPDATESHLVWVGRVITVVLGLIMVVGALIIPIWGITRFIILITSLVTGPMILPTIWGLFSKSINSKVVWLTILTSVIVSTLYRVGFVSGGLFHEVSALRWLTSIIDMNEKVADIIVGNSVPLIVLITMELNARGRISEGWLRMQERIEQTKQVIFKPEASSLPAKIVAWSIAVLGFVMGGLSLRGGEGWQILAIFSGLLFLISLSIGLFCWFYDKKNIFNLNRPIKDVVVNQS